MNAFLVWVFMPALASVVFFFTRRWERGSHLAGVVIALTLAWLAWALPIGEPIRLRLWTGMPSLRVDESTTFLGIRLLIDNSIRPLLIILYITIAFWFGGAYFARTGSLFIPIGFGIASLLAAAWAVTPAIYAILIIELAFLLCVPIFSFPGKPVGRGVRRFLTFQISGMGLVLIMGWSLAVAAQQGLSPGDLRSGIALLGLGYMLILGIIPFHSWIPMTAEESNPYSSAFVYFLLPTAVLITVIDSLIRYTATPVSSDIYSAIRAIGLLMGLGGGLGAILERHIGRMMGYGVIHQIGTALLLLSLYEITTPSRPLAGLFFANLLPQGIALALWALALSRVDQEKKSLLLDTLQGKDSHPPIESTAIILAIFSLSGLPSLGSFPIYLPLWTALAERSIWVVISNIFGNILLFAAGLRVLVVLFNHSKQDGRTFSENRLLIGLLLIGALALFVIGLFPNTFIPFLTQTAVQLSSPK